VSREQKLLLQKIKTFSYNIENLHVFLRRKKDLIVLLFMGTKQHGNAEVA